MERSPSFHSLIGVGTPSAVPSASLEHRGERQEAASHIPLSRDFGTERSCSRLPGSMEELATHSDQESGPQYPPETRSDDVPFGQFFSEGNKRDFLTKTEISTRLSDGYAADASALFTPNLRTYHEYKSTFQYPKHADSSHEKNIHLRPEYSPIGKFHAERPQEARIEANSSYGPEASYPARLDNTQVNISTFQYVKNANSYYNENIHSEYSTRNKLPLQYSELETATNLMQDSPSSFPIKNHNTRDVNGTFPYLSPEYSQGSNPHNHQHGTAQNVPLGIPTPSQTYINPLQS